jgi:molecular chaperone GrpE (heat shock protein)
MSKGKWFNKFQKDPQNMSLGINDVKEVRDDMDSLKQQISRNQKEMQETLNTLNRVSAEHDKLQQSYYETLKMLSESLLRQEMLLKFVEENRKYKERLEEMIRQNGVERFSPIQGNSVPRDSCKVVAFFPSGELVPGSVAKVICDGFQKNGRILIPATVMESVAPAEKGLGQPQADVPIENRQ